METRKRVLGQEHPDTLTSMANLASTFWSQGRWKEAEELEMQVMETSVRVLGQPEGACAEGTYAEGAYAEGAHVEGTYAEGAHVEGSVESMQEGMSHLANATHHVTAQLAVTHRSTSRCDLVRVRTSAT
jgi:Tetratricopeptide repeat